MNIYIKNKDEILAISKGDNDQKRAYDVGVALDIFDQRHGLEHDDLLRAQYMQHLGLPMSMAYEQLLESEA